MGAGNPNPPSVLPRPVRRHAGLAVALALLAEALAGWRPGLAAPDVEAALGAALSRAEVLVQQNPGNLKARFLLAKTYMRAHRDADAVVPLTWILERQRVPTVVFHLGLAYARSGRIERAVPLWLEIVQGTDPTRVGKPLSTSTMIWLGLALDKQGNHALALEWFQKALRIDPSSMKARLNAGIQHFRIAQAAGEADEPAHAVKDRYGQAVQEWLLLLRAQPPRAATIKVLGFVGQAMARRGDLDRARKSFERILALDPGNDTAARALESLANRRDPGEETRPPPPPPPPPPVVDGVPPPPPDVAGMIYNPPLMDDIEAEELFLQGLEHKDGGHWDKALFSFVKAIEISPGFTQVYLQLGEVYTQLARLAPTEDQFTERLQLALQTYEKVSTLAPGTLNDTAAHGQRVEVKRLHQGGFFGFHLDLARTAVTENRFQDAFEESMLLLSNRQLLARHRFPPEFFHDLAAILPSLRTGNLQDLQFFLEDLTQKYPDEHLIVYLLGHTYRLGGKTQLARETLLRFRDALARFSPEEPLVNELQSRALRSTGQLVDRFLLGSYAFSRDLQEDARKHLTAFTDASGPETLFHKEAQSLLARVLQSDPGSRVTFEGELTELVAAVPRAALIFGEFPDAANAEPAVQEGLEEFLRTRARHGVGRLGLVWVLKIRGEKIAGGAALTAKGHQLSLDLLRAKQTDPDWHFRAGSTALSWGFNDLGRSHLKVAGDILLARNLFRSRSFSRRAFEASRELRLQHHLVQAGIMLDFARTYDRDALECYLEQFHLDVALGNGIRAAANLFEWGWAAFHVPWHRQVLLTDFGILLTLSLLLTLFGAATALVLRHFDGFHHLFAEYFRKLVTERRPHGKLVLTIPIFSGLVFLSLFPTGFILFFPVLAWPFLSRIERRVYGVLLVAFLLVPLVFSPAPASRLKRLRLVHDVEAGDVGAARAEFSRALSEDPGDVVARYMLGLAELREGRTAPAREHFLKLYERDPHDVGVLINMGVIEAQGGDAKRALGLLNEAVARDPLSSRAFYDLATVMGSLGNEDKAAQYLKWATAASQDPDMLRRYKSHTSDLPRLVLMDAPLPADRLDELFSLWSAPDGLSVLSRLMVFVLWFFGGGGLAAYLVFLRERLSIHLARCHRCARAGCNLCLNTIGGRTHLCDVCHSQEPPSPEQEKAMARERRQERATRGRRKALAANLVLPGSGLYFAGLPHLGAPLQGLFLAALLAYLSGGGWLAAAVFDPPSAGIYGLLVWLFLAVAGAIHLGSLAALYQVQDRLDDGT